MTLATPPAQDDHAAPSAIPAGGVATVIFLGVAAGVQMSDRGLQAILSPAIREAFQVGDAVMGALHGIAGVLVASALAVPMAKLADRHSRKLLLLLLIAAWTGLTALGALAPNFPLFFLGRAASGVTEFAMIPVVYSMIPDLVGERRRVNANLGFAALMATGASAGFYLGGNLLDFTTQLSASGAFGGLSPWRMAMLMLSAAGVPLLLAGLATADPPRAALAAETGAGESLAAFVRARRVQILQLIGAAGGLAIAVQAATPMIAMALVRRYHADLAVVGHGLGIILLASSLASLPIAGLVDRLLRPRMGERSRPAVMGAAAAIAVPCAAGLGLAPEVGGAMVLVAAFLLVTGVANALIPTMLQDIAPASLRARCFAVYSFIIAAFCAVGPVLSGGVSDLLAGGNLLVSIAAVAVPALVLAAISAFAASRGERRVVALARA